MRSLVKTALVANDLSRCESRTAPGRGFGGVTVVAPPSEVLGFLGSGIISVLDWNSVRNGISSNEREGRVLLRVQVRLGGEDDGGMVFELDTVAFWVLKVTERGSGGGGEMMVLV